MISLSRRRRRTIPAHKKGPRNRGGLKELLEFYYREINKPEFIPHDPVQFPHRYKNKKDIEIAAFLAATIAWGRRDLILKSAEKMFNLMGKSPHAFIMKDGIGVLEEKVLYDFEAGRRRSIHRTFFEDDLLYFCRGLKTCYAKYGSLEDLFASARGIWEGISLFRETMAAGQHAGDFAGGEQLKSAENHAVRCSAAGQRSYSKHISNPEAGSACKRLNLALRWLVRQEGPVDLGLWKKISPASLFIPLDLHVGRSARQLGLLDDSRKANDKKAVITITEKLRSLCPDDPVKYDLALFGYSMKTGLK